jgi:ferrous-iron efflux pump FieF
VSGNAGQDPDARLIRSATYASVGVAGILIAAKFVAWQATGSVSLLSTLLDSLLDACASLINLYAVRPALQPADAEHRFGHGKAEALSGLAQSAFIGGSGLFLIIEAVDRLITPQPISQGMAGISVMGLSILLTLLLVGFQTYVVRRTGSVAISADSLHYRADLLVNVGVIIAIVIGVYWNQPLADPLIALAIAAYILKGAWEIGRTSMDMLMDHELPEEDRQKIIDLALVNPDVLGVHEMRSRRSGRDIFIQMHIDMDPQIPLLYAHGISEEVEMRIRKAYPNAEVIIHEDPAGFGDQEDIKPDDVEVAAEDQPNRSP